MKYLDPKADLTFKKIFGNHPNRLRNLLSLGLPVTQITQATGLTEEEIKQMKL